MHLDRAEAAGEGHLVAGLQALVPEQQELMGEERIVDAIEDHVGHRLRQVHALDLHPKRRAQRPQLERVLAPFSDTGHGFSPSVLMRSHRHLACGIP